MSLRDLKVGDRVQVFDQWSRKVPKSGWDGEVVKVGTKLITVKYRYSTSVFRLDTGHLNSKDFPHHARIATIEQVAEDIRRRELIDTLNSLGLEVKRRVDLSTSKIEAVIQALREFE